MKVKKIGVISDTHIPRAASEVPQAIFAVFSGVDMIIHAGDLVSDTVIDELSDIAPVVSVRGNMDPQDAPRPVKRVVEIEGEGVKIGLIHGWGGPDDLHERVRYEFGDEVACIVFGHSHLPYNDFVGGVLMFNPGSPTDKRFAPYRSVGILTISNGSVVGEVMRLP